MGDRVFLVPDGEPLERGVELRTTSRSYPAWTSGTISWLPGFSRYSYVIQQKDGHPRWESQSRVPQFNGQRCSQGVNIIDDGEFDKRSHQIVLDETSLEAVKADLLAKLQVMIDGKLQVIIDDSISGFRSEVLGAIERKESPAGGWLRWFFSRYEDNFESVQRRVRVVGEDMEAMKSSMQARLTSVEEGHTALGKQMRSLQGLTDDARSKEALQLADVEMLVGKHRQSSKREFASLRQELRDAADTRSELALKLEGLETVVSEHRQFTEREFTSLQQELRDAADVRSEVAFKLKDLEMKARQQHQSSERLRRELEDVRDRFSAVPCCSGAIGAASPREGEQESGPAQWHKIDSDLASPPTSATELGQACEPDETGKPLQTEPHSDGLPALQTGSRGPAADLDSPFFTSPPHPSELKSRGITLDVEQEILAALRRGDPGEKKATLMKKLHLKVHPDKGGTAEAVLWFKAWKEQHLQWFLGEGFLKWQAECGA